MESVLIKKQVKKLSKTYIEDGVTYTINVNIRYDNDCGNDHNSFSITGDIYDRGKRGNKPIIDRNYVSGGCIHEEIEKRFPELKKYIKWHLMSSDEPMHYLANTLYNASDKDCNGYRSGEVSRRETRLSFGDNPIKHDLDNKFIKFLETAQKETLKDSNFDFKVIQYNHKDWETFGSKFTFEGYAQEWYQCPFDTQQEALDFLYALQHCNPKFETVTTNWSKGKEPELAAARHSAIWPDATLEQLQDESALTERLPALIEEFKHDVEELGFEF